MTSKRSRMNRKLMRAVADKLESLRGEHINLWDQRTFTAEMSCGTAHCIGGWAIVIDGKYAKKLERRNELAKYGYRFSPWRTAERLLGITPTESHVLFNGGFMWGATPRQVAARLREFARKGRVEP